MFFFAYAVQAVSSRSAELPVAAVGPRLFAIFSTLFAIVSNDVRTSRIVIMVARLDLCSSLR